MDLHISESLVIPSAELSWNFSRSTGPGGQHVNTSDSRVELSWMPASSRVLSTWQRERLVQKLGAKLVGGAVVVRASEERSQFRNRQIAMERLSALIVKVNCSPKVGLRNQNYFWGVFSCEHAAH